MPSPSPWEGGGDMMTRGELPLLREEGKGRGELILGCKVKKFTITKKQISSRSKTVTCLGASQRDRLEFRGNNCSSASTGQSSLEDSILTMDPQLKVSSCSYILEQLVSFV